VIDDAFVYITLKNVNSGYFGVAEPNDTLSHIIAAQDSR
jgi:hypothetical protein